MVTQVKNSGIPVSFLNGLSETRVALFLVLEPCPNHLVWVCD